MADLTSSPTTTGEHGVSSSVSSANRIIIVLGSLILLALLALIIVVSIQSRRGPDGPRANVGPDETIGRGDLDAPPPAPPKPVADPNRIRETLREGKTYQVHLKAGINSRVEDEDWGIRAVTNLIYVGEMVLNRTIESNDGRRIVELRHFEVCRSVKLLHEVEDVEIQLGPAGHLALAALHLHFPEVGTAVIGAKEAAETVLAAGAGPVAQSAATKAFACVDSLSGKKIRITYVDGIGVESIQPVGCSLTPDERDFAFATAALSDCYLFPDIDIAPGKTWKVDGSQLVGFLDPSLRGIPHGSVTVVREADDTNDVARHANLRIQSGLIQITNSDASRHRQGTFAPKGRIRYSLDHGYVESGQLEGAITIEDVSKDHLLFKASFKLQPTITLDYSCRMLN